MFFMTFLAFELAFELAVSGCILHDFLDVEGMGLTANYLLIVHRLGSRRLRRHIIEQNVFFQSCFYLEIRRMKTVSLDFFKLKLPASI